MKACVSDGFRGRREELKAMFPERQKIHPIFPINCGKTYKTPLPDSDVAKTS